MIEGAIRNLYVVSKHTAGVEEVERHFVQLPSYNEKGFYRDAVSMDAFRRRMQLRHIKCDKEGRCWAMRVDFWYRTQMHADYLIDLEVNKHTDINLFPASVEHHHASLRDFYDAIGYDYKRNKLAVEPRRL